MATTRKSQDEEETTDTAGRKHDSRGRFASDSETENGRESQNGPSQVNGQGSRNGQRSQGDASQKRVINRAIRVLNEIEARVHELREELEEQGGTGGERSGNGSGARGQVRHPETDGRLRQNRNGEVNGGEEGDGNEEEEGVEEIGNRNRSGGRR